MGYKISVKADRTTWTVDDDGPADFHTIQQAINSPDVKGGDTILVRAGIYYEQVIVNKSVSLVGEDSDSTVVDGNGIGSVISITANNVNISGFTIQYSGNKYDDSGIYIDHSSGDDISHNTITNNRNGMYLDSSSNNMFSSNTITNNDNGISLFSSSNNVISGNTISLSNDDGISLFSSSNNVVSGNTITNNRYGISPLDSSNNIIYRNNFDNTDQVWSDSTNVWDDGDEGNYWSDYEERYPNATEIDNSGIWNTPYAIDEDNQDNHPLMGMFSDFSVTHEEEMYPVTTICNSTISDFRFEIGRETGNKIIRFNVAGKYSTVGFCRVMIPTKLMNYPYIVLVGLEEIIPTLLDVSNETYVYLYFTYIHSSQIITIISPKTLHLYNELLDKHVKLQTDLYNLNATYYDLLNNYSILLGNYSQLQKSYHEHLLDYSKNVHNIRNLMYIFAATTAIFIITTIYLSKRAHEGKTSARKQPIKP
jgi:parallel beta-helix repeat protein